MPFIEELKRRNVFRVGIAYAVVAWLVLQLADVLLNNIEAPGWLFQSILMVLALGFPVVLLFAWAFELTPDGIKKEAEVDRRGSITPTTGRRLDRWIMVLLILGLGFFAYDKFVLDPSRDSALTAAAVEQVRSELQVESKTESRAENSVAVLPFADLSQDGDQQYFSDGIAEELLNALVRVDGLKVASRTSSFTYRGDEKNLRDIADALAVNYILEGSVRRAGNTVRITAQLIDAHSDRHLWSQTYDRDLNDVLAIQNEIANAIVDSLKEELGLAIGPGEVAIASATNSMDAYDLYLKGRSLILARADIGQAVVLLEQAVAIDPGFAKAWEVLGAAYLLAPSWGYEVGEDPLARAIAASERALELDGNLALAWSVIGNVSKSLNLFSFETALEYDNRATALDPTNATVHLWAALHWSELGYLDQAIPLLQRCLELDPAYENCRRHLALMEYVTGNEEEVLRLFQEGAENGFSGNEAIFLPLILRRQGRAAAAYVASGMISGQGFPVRDLLDIIEYPQADHEAARQRFKYQKDQFSWSNVTTIASVSAFFGDYEDMLVYYQDTSNWVWTPDLQAFRHSAEFKQLARMFGLTEYWLKYGFPPMCRPLGDEDFECD